MRVLDIPQSGSRGKVVASRNRFGPFRRERVSPDQPGTAAQRGVWGTMTMLSGLWNKLAEEQRVGWRRLAEEVHSRPKLGQSGSLDGCLLFKKLNSVLVTCGREPLLDPPPLPRFGPNPVIGFEARRDGSKIVFKLQITRRGRWEARSPLEDTMVFGWTPCNAGAAKNSLYSFLGLLPAPVEWESDITAAYLAKLKQWRKLPDKRYRVPLAGSRVFIRVWQQVNGWENHLGMFHASALVPADAGGEQVAIASSGRKAGVSTNLPRQRQALTAPGGQEENCNGRCGQSTERAGSGRGREGTKLDGVGGLYNSHARKRLRG